MHIIHSMLTFAGAVFAGSSVLNLFEVYALRDFSTQLGTCYSCALQVEFWGTALLTIIGSLLFVATLIVFVQFSAVHKNPDRKFGMAVAAGILYPLLFWVFDKLFGKLPDAAFMIAAWGYVIIVPIAIASAILMSGNHRAIHRFMQKARKMEESY